MQHLCDAPVMKDLNLIQMFCQVGLRILREYLIKTILPAMFHYDLYYYWEQTGE